MQRVLPRPRRVVAREGDSDDEAAAGSDAETSALQDEPTVARAAEADDVRGEPIDPPPSLFSASPRFASASQVNLHTFDPRRSAGFAETKIGGHALDHRRPFDGGWQRSLHGPIKTAVVSAVSALGAALAPPSARSSHAFDARRQDALVYSSVKIAGHPMDHVPFRDRGQPSRPLWGYVPNWGWPGPGVEPRGLPPPPAPVLRPPTARMYQIEPNVLANLYDCSRCLRLRQTPRVQLCCGHVLCASCVSSRSIRHVEHERSCFLECVRCRDLLAVEAVVFTNHVVRLQEPLVRTLSELAGREEAAPASSLSTFSRLGLAWKHGGVIAVLSFLAGRLYPAGKTSRSSLGTWHGVRSDSTGEDAQDLASPPQEVVARLLLDDVADLAKQLPPSAEEIVASGEDRWKKRVQGLKPPSKLLKFEFVKTLGVGNFAEVMLVQNRKGEQTVLKESDKLPEAVNEIKILSCITSPHVVRILQYFIEEIGHRHFAYIEMEYCDGGDLMRLLKDKGPVEEASFEGIFQQLCKGLKEIHERGIVHRDLKPGNVLMTSEGTAKIADFGVSTCLESDLLTHHAAGTMAYMAPEVRRYFLGEDVSYDAKADIWSLGALAVAMLTGNPEPRVATRPVEEVVDELREAGLSAKSLHLIERTLQRRPEKRPSLVELLDGLTPVSARL